MVEVIIRVVLALAPAGVAAFHKHPDWSTTGQYAALALVWTVMVNVVERRELREGTVATAIAAIDAALLAFGLAVCGHAGDMGAFALIPLVWSVRRFSVNPLHVAPVAALALLASPFALGAKGFSWPVAAQAGAVLFLGLLVGRPRQLIVRHEVPVEVEPAEPTEDLTPVVDELKESYRSLREHARDIERRSRRDRTAMHLFESVAAGEGAFPSLVKSLAEVAGAEGTVLFATAEAGRKLVMAASHGTVPEVVPATRFDLPANASENQVKNQIERKLDAWEAADDRQVTAVLLRHQSRIVGLVGLIDPNVETLTTGRDRIEEVADVVAALCVQSREREDHRRRLAEAETLYSVAAVTLGAESRASMVARVVREIGAALHLDHFGVFALEGNESLNLATDGFSLDVMPEMSYAYGAGVQGWLKTGAPEVVLSDALDDERLTKTFAIKKRLGSVAILPVQFGELPYGFVSAATTRVGGIDTPALETLRVVVAEMAQALARLENPLRDPEGLMTPREFRDLCSSTPGSIVYLEVLKKDEIAQNYGRPALDLATRKFATRARARLPQGSGLTRRDEGDYVALLAGMDEESARSWANDLVATAAMVPVTTPDGRLRLPLAIRSKVAKVGVQSST